MIEIKNSKGTHIHDKAFRSAMSDLRVARDFLQHYLPLPVLQMVALSTLKLCKESYIDEELKPLIADVLYSVTSKDKNNKFPIFIYVLCEHLSTPQKLISWRMMKYTCRIIDQHLKETDGKTLPLIIPLVVYNGRVKYPYSTSIYDLFTEDNRALAKQYMFNSFQLIDFTQIPDEDIRKHQWSSLMEILLKHSLSRDVMNCLESLKKEIRELANKNADDYILGMLNYVIKSTEMRDWERFREFLHQSLPQPLEQQAMTLAQVLENKGFQRGMQRGEQKGQYNLLLGQLECKFKVIPEHYRLRLEEADATTLLRWGTRVLEAQALDEIFK
jgi:predicted transposase/invertase (TIGR01784 family)